MKKLILSLLLSLSLSLFSNPHQTIYLTNSDINKDINFPFKAGTTIRFELVDVTKSVGYTIEIHGNHIITFNFVRISSPDVIQVRTWMLDYTLTSNDVSYKIFKDTILRTDTLSIGKIILDVPHIKELSELSVSRNRLIHTENIQEITIYNISGELLYQTKNNFKDIFLPSNCVYIIISIEKNRIFKRKILVQ